MKIIYKDLLNLLSDKPSKKLLSDKLFQLGHEHEIHGEIFDLELTPNRGDCLSLLGLARDLNVFFGHTQSPQILEDQIQTLEIDFDNYSPEDCPKISFLEIEIEKTSNDYKPYLENYFNHLKNNKTNFFTDISNYISYELGQPTHCYDSDMLDGKIIFENRKCNNIFKTVLDSTITLNDDNCVFTIDNEIISLAGIMGGAATACTSKTKKVLVECAYFNPESIIGKSIKYNLTSDAAHKFERGVDILCQEKVLRRFAKVVQDHAKIKNIKLKTFSYDSESKYYNLYIPKNFNKINQILGISLEENDYVTYLKALGFHIDDMITVPSYRHDIRTHNDLAEEVARAIGYNNIKSIPLQLKKNVNKNEEDKIKKIESFLIKNGFSEIINFPFTSFNDKESIKIDNPLDSNRSNLRKSLKDSLIENLLYNERRQKDSIKLFEISDIYTKESEIVQKKKLGIIISGRLGNNYQDFSKKVDYEYFNKILNTDFGEAIFEIVEITRDGLDTKKKDKIFYVETVIDDISNTFFSNIIADNKTVNFISYNPVSEYPSTIRDFSFSVNNINAVDKLLDKLDSASNELIKSSFLFDFYKNEKLKTVKIGYRFIFQSQTKTLSDDEVDKIIMEIINPILDLDGISIPGM